MAQLQAKLKEARFFSTESVLFCKVSIKEDTCKSISHSLHAQVEEQLKELSGVHSKMTEEREAIARVQKYHDDEVSDSMKEVHIFISEC